MNKIYRRLWSTARHCWVVASELTAAKGKASRTVGSTLMVVAGLVLAPLASAQESPVEEDEASEEHGASVQPQAPTPFMPPAAFAFAPLSSPGLSPLAVYSQYAYVSDLHYRNASIDGDLLLILGSRSVIKGSDSVAYGNLVFSDGTMNTAIGHGVKIYTSYATAVGARAIADGVGTIALGNYANAFTRNSIAIGSGALIDKGAGISKIAIGGDSRAGSDGWTGAIALGGDAKAEYDSLSFGYKSGATREGAVAIGTGAVAEAIGAIALGKGATAKEEFTLSVGSSDQRRRIVNVEDARLNASSTDAVTGKQLYVAKQDIATATRTAVDARVVAERALVSSGLIGLDGATIRIGGDDNRNSLTISKKDGGTRFLGGVRNGTLTGSSTDAVNGQQLFATNANVSAARTVADQANAKAEALGGLLGQSTPDGAVRLGAENTGSMMDVRNKSGGSRKMTGVAEGVLGATSTDAVNGRQLHATNTNVSAARSAADTAQRTADAVKVTADAALGGVGHLQGLVAEVASDGTMRLGAENSGGVIDVRNKSGGSRKVSGVAEGVLGATSTDAVNGRQLHATNTNVAAARSAAETAQRAADAVKVTADAAQGGVRHLQGLVAEVASDGNMRLGAENSGAVVDVRNKSNGTRRLTGLSDGALGSASTEAVTGRQLHATNQLVDTQGQALLAHGQTLTAHGQQLGLHDRRIGDNRTDLDKLRADFEDFDPDLDGVVRFAADGSVDMGGGKVRGIAAGDISSAASTEAVNGGQLFTTNERVSVIEEQSQFVRIGEGGRRLPAQAGLVSVAIGDGAEATQGSEGAVALGAYASAQGKNSVAIGRAAVVGDTADQSFALGTQSEAYASSSMAFGAAARTTDGAEMSVAIGNESIASKANSVSFGNDLLKRRLMNVGRGTSVNEVTTFEQLNEAVLGLGGGAGMGSMGEFIAPSYTVQGSVHSNVGDALAVLDSAVLLASGRTSNMEDRFNSIFGSVSQLDMSGEGAIVLSNLGEGGIAAGSRDAVNGGQLFETNQRINENRGDLEKLKAVAQDIFHISSRFAVNAEFIDYNGVRLTGVGAGEIGANSSDVVVGSQLHETNSRVDALTREHHYFAIGADELSVPAEAGLVGVAVGDGAEASLVFEGATAIGTYATARGKNSVALGRASHVRGDAEDGFALGGRSQVHVIGGVALGAESVVTESATNGVALGFQSTAVEANTVSIGTNGLKRRIVNVANGRNATDAATVGQLRGALSTLGADIDAEGNVSTAGFTTQGQHHASLGQALTALDTTVTTTNTRVSNVEAQLTSIFSSTPTTQANGTAQLTLAGAQGMVISNVANGLVAAGSRDAVNGGQLHAVQQQLNGRMDGLEQRVDGQPQARASLAAARTTTTDEATTEDTPQANAPQVASTADAPKPQPAAAPTPKADAPEDVKPQVDTADLERMLARANEYTDGISREVDARLNKMDKRFNRMAAMNSAQAAMAMNTAGLATYNRLGAGVGYSDGESAMAVGYQRVLNDKGSATFSLNGAFTNSGERSMGVGVGIGW